MLRYTANEGIVQMAEPTMVQARFRDDGELVEAQYEHGNETVAVAVSGRSEGDRSFGALTFRVGERTLLTVTAEVVSEQAYAAGDATIVTFAGDGVDRRVALDLSTSPASVVARDGDVVHTASFDLRTWDLTDDSQQQQRQLPGALMDRVEPLLPALNALVAYHVGMSEGRFSAVRGRPPVGLPERLGGEASTMFDSGSTACHAWCWGSAGAGAAACCLLTGGVLCVLCAGAEAAAGSVCSDSC